MKKANLAPSHMYMGKIPYHDNEFDWNFIFLWNSIHLPPILEPQ